MPSKLGPLARAFALMVPIFAALLSSSALLIEYLSPVPYFCDAGGGCAALRRTVFASVFHIPTPAFGLVAFALLGTLALLCGVRPRLWLVLLALPVMLVGVFLIAVQVRSGVFCRFCLIVDGSACLLLPLALVRQLTRWDPPEAVAPRVALGGIALLSVLAPPVHAMVQGERTPSLITRELEASQPGVVTLIDFIDYECPYCRKANADLAPVLAKHRGKVRVVRKNVPLASIHPHAMVAAHAASCGEQMGQGDKMSEALFAADVAELTVEGTSLIALSLGLEETAFRECLRSPETDSLIRADMKDFLAVGGEALPLMWVGSKRLSGYEEGTRIADAFNEALSAHR